MKYLEMLKLCRKENCFGSQFYIAEELDCQLTDVYEVSCTPIRFEELCNLAHECYLHSDYNNILPICKAIAKLEQAYIKKVGDDPLELNKWDILNEAAYLE